MEPHPPAPLRARKGEYGTLPLTRRAPARRPDSAATGDTILADGVTSGGDGCCGSGIAATAGEEMIPAERLSLRLGVLRKTDRHVGHVRDGPLKVVRGQRVDIHVGGRVHEVNGVGDAVANGPLHRVHVVAKGANELAGVGDDTLAKLWREVVVLDVILALARVVLDRQDLVLAETDAADELVPVDELLHDHGEQAG